METNENGENFFSPSSNETSKKENKTVKTESIEAVDPRIESMEKLAEEIAEKTKNEEKTLATLPVVEKDSKIAESMSPFAKEVPLSDCRYFFSALVPKMKSIDDAVAYPVISFFANALSAEYGRTLKEKTGEEMPNLFVALPKNEMSETSDFAGYNLKGPITVLAGGNVGRFAGCQMENGEFLVRGNSRYETGSGMTGGRITIEGDAGDWLGRNNNGGNISVIGNAGDFVAEGMKKGTISVLGKSGANAAKNMTGGTFVSEGSVESFDETAFDLQNLGVIWYLGTKIWNNGNFTNEGKRMNEEGKIPQKKKISGN